MCEAVASLARHPSTPAAAGPAGVSPGWQLAFYGWLLLTLVLLLLPGAMIAQVQAGLASWLSLPQGLDRVPGMGLSDKVVHGLLFAVLGLLATRVWWRFPPFARIMLALLVLGAGIEVVQHFIPGRGASVGDFVADSVGLMAGFAVTRRWRRARG